MGCRQQNISIMLIILELNLATALKDNQKNISINTLATKRGLRKLFILYWKGQAGNSDKE